jgi:hypothetical protein
MVEQVRRELQNMGYQTVGGFHFGASGMVVINMGSLQLAQNLRNRKSVKMPKLSKHPS